ncbi:hypothetical protein, partial [Nostoc sp. LEGE 12450]|uniref:hypothetical protein n=1 Tax=Nostoc sp. LEGE 12450 TaxID=1828643 RepID=UPI001D1573DD
GKEGREGRGREINKYIQGYNSHKNYYKFLFIPPVPPAQESFFHDDLTFSHRSQRSFGSMGFFGFNK